VTSAKGKVKRHPSVTKSKTGLKTKNPSLTKSSPDIKEQSADIRPSKDRPFPVLGFGASAGGLEAFKEFFRNMPPESGMAFVLVSHLDPGHARHADRDPSAGHEDACC
jgi:two-component system, chemotaxis family, CheB/CheR fusion protein